MTEYCICGHKFSCHSRISTAFKNEKGEWGPWHTFKLDNLKLIEDMAQSKGLV